MKWSWKFGQEIMPLLVTRRALKEILIEYDGPRLAILEQPPDQILALCIDEDKNGVRWIRSPLSSLEYEALMRGALTVRAALLKPGMVLVEYSHDKDEKLQSAWELDPTQVPDDVLPDVDTLLPNYVMISHPSTLAPNVSAEFRLGTKGTRDIPEHIISFQRLSAVTAGIQHLWDAIGSTLTARPTVLNAYATSRGSLAIRVQVDDKETFSQVAAVYRELTRATYDRKQLVETLSAKSARVIRRYSEYLKMLDENSLDVFAEWYAGVAFIGHAGAQRNRKHIRVPAPEVATPKRIVRAGYLEGFGRSPRHFEFYDPDTGARITGLIHKDLRDFPLRDELYLGHRRKYLVEIESVRVGSNPPKYTLLAFSPDDNA